MHSYSCRFLSSSASFLSCDASWPCPFPSSSAWQFHLPWKYVCKAWCGRIFFGTLWTSWANDRQMSWGIMRIGRCRRHNTGIAGWNWCFEDPGDVVGIRFQVIHHLRSHRCNIYHSILWSLDFQVWGPKDIVSYVKIGPRSFGCLAHCQFRSHRSYDQPSLAISEM